MGIFRNTRKILEKRQRAKQIKLMNEEGLDGFDWHEKQAKWPLHRIVEVSFAVISVFVWAIILFRIFTSCNGEYEKMILLNDKAAEIYPLTQNEVMRIHSSTDQQEDGSVLVYYPVYLEETDNMQFTARIRRRALPPNAGETGYTFILRESGAEGDTYHPLSYYSGEKNWFYTFFRLCFEGVEFHEDHVYTFLVFEGGYTPESVDQPYPLTASRFHFTIYNSETYCNHTVPKNSVYERVKE